jgi:hypothetical protein
MQHLSTTEQPHHDRIVTSLVALVLALAMSSPARAAIIIEYESMLEIDAGQHGQARPVAVSCDPVAGEICVTDARAAALHVLDRSGAPVFATSALARLSLPQDACLDARGGFVLTDHDQDLARTIRKLDLRGEPVPYTPVRPLPDWHPEHLVIAADGTYLTLDSLHALLARHDPDTGALLWQRRVVDGASDALELGRPVETPDGRIYVPGGELHQILVCDRDGRRIAAFGELGTGAGRLVFPVAVACGPQGTILVLDRMRCKILVFDAEHRFVTEYGQLGAAPGQLYHPVSLASAGDGRVHVAQGYQGRVQTYRIFSTDALR